MANAQPNNYVELGVMVIEQLCLENGEMCIRDRLIRRAETPTDYFSTFDFTGMFDKYTK